MKTWHLIIFLLVFFSLYTTLHIYLWGWLGRYFQGSAGIHSAKIIFLFFALLYPISRFVNRFLSFYISFLSTAGSLWLAFVLYFLLVALTIDILHVILNRITTISFILNKSRIALSILLILVISIVAWGYYTAYHPLLNTLDLEFPRKTDGPSLLKIVLVTDIHLGTVIRNSHLAAVINLINSQNPDIVLLGGDIIDEGCAPVLAHRMEKDFAGISSRYGIYAVTGNHEYIGGDVDKIVECLSASGIHFLRDSGTEVCGIFLAGRDDISGKRFGEKPRESLDTILVKNTSGRPVVLMDHQPSASAVNDAVRCSVNLLLCGHTHNGQLWPFNHVVRMIYGISHGLIKKDSTYVYVSAGCGTWGPPVRTTCSPEISLIRIHFK